MLTVFEFTINIPFYMWSLHSPSSPYGILKILIYVLDSPPREGKKVEAPLTFPNRDFFSA